MRRCGEKLRTAADQEDKMSNVKNSGVTGPLCPSCHRNPQIDDGDPRCSSCLEAGARVEARPMSVKECHALRYSTWLATSMMPPENRVRLHRLLATIAATEAERDRLQRVVDHYATGAGYCDGCPRCHAMHGEEVAEARVAQLEEALRYIADASPYASEAMELITKASHALAASNAEDWGGADMEHPDGPKCSCGEPAMHQSGWCGCCREGGVR